MSELSAVEWLALLPPIIAVAAAVWWKEVISALLAGIFAGAWLHYGDPLTAAARIFDTVILQELVPEPVDGAVDSSHISIILFTLLLGSLVSLLAASGASGALLSRIERHAGTRRRGQVLTWLLGFLIFFDDYANTMLVGGTMRPLTDRLRISREKLAFLVDSTSAPVAGLAIVSTWVGVEVGSIAAGADAIGLKTDAYTLFLQSLPYRFYPLYLLAFTLAIAATGRDFGAMLRAEQTTRHQPVPSTPNEQSQATSKPRPMQLAIGPLAVLVFGLLGGMLVTGFRGWHAGASPDDVIWSTRTWSAVLDQSDPMRMLLLASAAAVCSAVLMTVFGGYLKLAGAMAAIVDGAKTMLPAVIILVLAWSLARLCDANHLDTAGTLNHMVGDAMPAGLLPTVAFLLAAAVSFATGSSWGTMGLLIPILMTVAAGINSITTGEVNTPGVTITLTATIGAVLAGSIFGDHCSPLSDTTVLSSAASGCDHLRHVATQMPYALTVGIVSIVCGYLPAGFGVPPWLLLPIGMVGVYAIVRFCGREPCDAASSAVNSDDGAEPTAGRS